MQRLDLIPLTTVVTVMAELWTDDSDALRPTTNGRKMRVKDSGGTKTVEVFHDGTIGQVSCNTGDLKFTDGSGNTRTVAQILTDSNTLTAHVANVSNPHGVTAAQVNCLAKDNTVVYTPTADYHPATKKYTDDGLAGKSNTGHTHVKADITDLGSPLYSVSQDTAPALGGELNAGANSIGFTQQNITGTAIDWRAGNKAAKALTANVTLTFTAPSKPGNLLLKLTQDATGGRTVTWPAAVKWAGGSAPTLSTAANAVDIVTFYYDGTNYYGVASLNFA